MHTAALPKQSMATNEFSVHSQRSVEIDGEFDNQKLVELAVAQYVFDGNTGQASFVISDERDLPRLEPTLLALILPVDFRVICQTLILAASRVCGCCCLAANEGILCDRKAF